MSVPDGRSSPGPPGADDEARDSSAGPSNGRDTAKVELDHGAPLLPQSLTTGNASAQDIRRNMATSYGASILAILLALVATPVILRLLGPVLYGVSVLLVSLTANLGLLDAGVSTAAVQLLSSELARANVRRAEAILATAQAFFLATSLVAFIVILALGLTLGSLFHLSGVPLGEARIGLWLCGAALAIRLAATSSRVAVYGSGYSWRSRWLSLLSPVLLYTGEIGVVLAGGGLLGYLAVPLGLAVLQAQWIRVIARRLGLATPLRTRPQRAILAELLRSGWRNAVISVAGTLSYQFDGSVISAVRNAGEVTPYSLGVSVAGVTRTLATTGTAHLLPTFAHSETLGDRARQYRYYSRAIAAGLVIAVPLVATLVALGHPLLHLWLGAVPRDTYAVTVLAGVGLLLQLPGGQTFVLMTGAGRNRTLVRYALPLAILNVIFSVAATFVIGPLGPVVGGLPQAAVFEFAILPVVACRLLGARVSSYARDTLCAPAAALVGSAAVGAIIVTIGVGPPLASVPESAGITLVGWVTGAALMLRRDKDLLRKPTITLARLRHRAR